MTKIRKEQCINGSNNMKGRKIEHEYDGDTRDMTRRKQVVVSRLRTGYTKATHGPRMNGITDLQCPFLRHRTYSRSRPTRLHRNQTDQKRDNDDTRNMDKRSKRNEKDYRIYEKNMLL
jgi:hypothetical protein